MFLIDDVFDIFYLVRHLFFVLSGGKSVYVDLSEKGIIVASCGEITPLKVYCPAALYCLLKLT